MESKHYWEGQRVGVVDRLAAIRRRQLDRDGVIAADSCYLTGTALLDDFEELILVGADELAWTVLETAEFYLERARDKDDPRALEDGASPALVHADRLARWSFARWLKSGVVEQDALREAVSLRDNWIHDLPAPADIAQGAPELARWMAEAVLVGEFAIAISMYEQAARKPIGPKQTPRTTAEIVFRVASALARPEDAPLRARAEEAIGALYRDMTAWDAPGFRKANLLPEERLLFAHMRARLSNGPQDPITLIRNMRDSL